MKHLVAATKVSDPVGHGRRRVNVVRCFVSPRELTVGERQAVEVSVVGPDQDVLTDDDGRGLDLTARLIRPGRFTGVTSTACNTHLEVANQNELVGDSRRRFPDTVDGVRLIPPLRRACLEVDSRSASPA